MTNTFIDRPSPNYGPREPIGGDVRVRHLIVHYTGMRSCEDALSRMCDEASRVSAHYLIDEAGSIYKMVPEDRRAWHAGVSFWAGVRDLNSTSIGIELVNPGHEFGYRSFPEAQMSAFAKLSQQIIKRHRINPDDVLGHSDIAPGRKTDPGELFPWREMAAYGIGTWPQTSKSLNQPVELETALGHLSNIGYAVPSSPNLGADILDVKTGTKDVIAAFQRRYRQNQVDGVLDLETSALIPAVGGQPHSA